MALKRQGAFQSVEIRKGYGESKKSPPLVLHKCELSVASDLKIVRMYGVKSPTEFNIVI